MTRTDLQTLVRYNDWANARILTCVKRLSDEQLTRPLVSSFPTIRDTLVHLVSAEWVWLQRWKGVTPTSPPAWVQSATLTTVGEVLREVEADRHGLIETWREEDLDGMIDFAYLSGASGRHSLQEMVLHMVNHSTYHRGQIVTMLRQVGAAPVSTDLITFYAETITRRQ